MAVLYSADLARLLIWTLDEYAGTDPVILSSPPDDEVSIEHVSRLIASEFNYESRLRFDTSYDDGQYRKSADNSKLVSLYGPLKLTLSKRVSGQQSSGSFLIMKIVENNLIYIDDGLFR